MFKKAEPAVHDRSKIRSGALISAGLLIGLLLIPQRATPTSARAQPTFQDTLNAPVKEFTLEKRPVIEGLFELVYKYQLPLAIEYVDSALVRRPVRLRLRNVAVRAAIEALARQLPEYRVSFSGGIVDWYSPRARRDPSNVLNMTISRFEVTHVDAMEASRRLQGEIFAKLHPGVGYGGDVFYGQTAPSEPKVTLNLDNQKVFEILNAIVASDGAAIWVVIVPPAGLNYFNWNRWAVYNLNPVGKNLLIDSLQKIFP